MIGLLPASPKALGLSLSTAKQKNKTKHTESSLTPTQANNRMLWPWLPVAAFSR